MEYQKWKRDSDELIVVTENAIESGKKLTDDYKKTVKHLYSVFGYLLGIIEMSEETTNQELN